MSKGREWRRKGAMILEEVLRNIEVGGNVELPKENRRR